MAEVYAWFDDEYVAHMGEVRREIASTARAGARRAESILAAHRAEGHSRITVTRGDLDYFVNLDDTRGDHAAAAIEYGRRRGVHGTTPGVHALRSAF